MPLFGSKQEKKTITEEELNQRLAELELRALELDRKEADAVNGFEALFIERYGARIDALKSKEESLRLGEDALTREHTKLTEQQAELSRRKLELDSREAEIIRREGELKAAEQERDSGWVKETEQHKQELERIRTERLSQLEAELADRRDELSRENDRLNDEANNIKAEREKLELDKKLLEVRKTKVDEHIESGTQDLRISLQQERATLETEREALNEVITSLRDDLARVEKTNENFETLKRRLGNKDPEAVLAELRAQEEEIKKLRQDLIDRPGENIRAEYQALIQERDNYRDMYSSSCERVAQMESEIAHSYENETRIAILEQENSSLVSIRDALERENSRLDEQIKLLNSSYEREQERDRRIANIERPYFEDEKPRRNADENINEIEWLDGIAESCKNYGLTFPKRILYAFHTALKVAEWSPLTVLAGVSGTGKTQLPALYAHFGGLNFLPLSVQPNWDSQESMLGFFNSIDNNFDAQPALNLLVQTQQAYSQEHPTGLKDTMTIILLDEMNLAYVELYFAEFLSKLELRRGKREVHIDIKLGSGMEPYKLNLGRNVLWAGTMNQDETTKTLSDKVLDRGIVINFPRPKTLERRAQLPALPEAAPLIRGKHWGSWFVKDSLFTGEGVGVEEIVKYKSFVESVNDALSYAGRALGHRVWQSMEYYMSNYPEVIAAHKSNDPDSLRRAMKISFEDALVQKVMPKLHGIETSGTHRELCLNKIGKLIADGIDGSGFSIMEDFTRAINFGYGQFMWNSAEYIND